MQKIKLLARNAEKVRSFLLNGDFSHIDTAAEEITDEFLLFAIRSRLLDLWSSSFPDPRQGAEIPIRVLIASSLAARFAPLYSLRKTGYALRSARVLGELGYSVEIIESGDGISSRGTKDDSLLSGDVLRKLLVKMEKLVADEQGKEVKEATVAPEQADISARIKVRQRLSRRAVRKPIDEEDADRRARAVSKQLVRWYNLCVGPSMLEYEAFEGRRIHILDTTPIEVALSAATYECSGVVKNDDGGYSRGYKLATVRTLLDRAGLLTQIEVGPIQRHDLELCRELLKRSPVLRSGDLLIEDRGFIDGATITELKRERHLDVIVPLRSKMESYREAVALAEKQGRWRKHPHREGQEIAFVKGVEHVWDECEVGLNGCVIRYWNEKKGCKDYIVLVTTDEQLNEVWMVKHYEERPEVEQDYQQMKSGGWYLQKLVTTRYTEIVYYLVTVVMAYSLYHLFANTEAGERFAGKTRQEIKFEQMKTKRTHVIVQAGGYFEIYETLRFARLILELRAEVQEKLKCWLDTMLVGQPTPT